MNRIGLEGNYEEMRIKFDLIFGGNSLAIITVVILPFFIKLCTYVITI